MGVADATDFHAQASGYLILTSVLFRRLGILFVSVDSQYRTPLSLIDIDSMSSAHERCMCSYLCLAYPSNHMASNKDIDKEIIYVSGIANTRSGTITDTQHLLDRIGIVYSTIQSYLLLTGLEHVPVCNERPDVVPRAA